MAKFTSSAWTTKEQAEKELKKIVAESAPWNRNPRIVSYTVPPCNITGQITEVSREYIGRKPPKTYYGIVVD